MAIQLRKCACRNCCNFFTLRNSNYCCTYCSRLASREAWDKRNPNYRKSKIYKDLINKRKRERYKNDKEYKQKILNTQKERTKELRKDDNFVKKRRAINNKYNRSEKGKERAKKYIKERSEKDLNFKILTRLRSRLYHAVHSQKTIKEESAVKILGCSTQELISYLESKFCKGMTLDNYGDWHIDHIKPCASFDLTDPEQQRDCFHYTNLQPLWAQDNQIKSDKY